MTCFRGAGLPAHSQNISVVMCVVVCFKDGGVAACSQNVSVVLCVVFCFKDVSLTACSQNVSVVIYVCGDLFSRCGMFTECQCSDVCGVADYLHEDVPAPVPLWLCAGRDVLHEVYSVSICL